MSKEKSLCMRARDLVEEMEYDEYTKFYFSLVTPQAEKLYSYLFSYCFQDKLGATMNFGSTAVVLNEEICDIDSYKDAYDYLVDKLGDKINQIVVLNYQLIGEEV